MAVPHLAATGAPGQPFLSASAATSLVSLTWTAPSPGTSPITAYNIYRGIVSGTLSLLTSVAADVLQYDDTTVINNTTYYYWVRASNNDAGEGNPSNEVGRTPQNFVLHAAEADPHVGYVLESLIDAKGDLIAGNAADTVARLAVGTTAQVLTADPAQATGMKWATANYTGALWDSGTDFPASPVIGQRRTRIDRGIDYYYDGTRWLSVQQHRSLMQPTAGTVAVTSTEARMPGPGSSGFAWAIERFETAIYVVAPNTGVSYWDIKLQTWTAVGPNITLGLANSTSGLDPDRYWSLVNTTVAGILATTVDALQIEYVKVGTPGSAIITGGLLVYRLVG